VIIMIMGPDDIKVRRLHRQHSSVVVVVPPDILEELEAGPGCYLAFEVRRGSRRVEIYNISPSVKKKERAHGDRDRKDKGGGVRQAGEV